MPTEQSACIHKHIKAGEGVRRVRESWVLGQGRGGRILRQLLGRPFYGCGFFVVSIFAMSEWGGVVVSGEPSIGVEKENGEEELMKSACAD